MQPPEANDPADGRGGGARRRGGRVPSDMQEVSLRDGSRIWVRPIRPDDRAQIEQGLKWLSPRSRYMRFHTYVDHLSKSQLDYLVDVDHNDHEALVALDPDLPDQPGVAVARYIRLHDQPEIAEAAITVIDTHQGRGIGTALIGLLERLAHERNITTFRNYVLAENNTMLEIFRELGGEVVPEGPGVYRVDVPVPAPEEGQPDTPVGRWVASVGRQTPERRAAYAYPIVWVLRLLGAIDPDAPEGARDPQLLKSWARRASDTDDDESSDDPTP